MEKATRMFIIEYELKVIACDMQLDSIKSDRAAARKIDDKETLAALNSDRRECAARRQAYVQAIADFKSIINEI